MENTITSLRQELNLEIFYPMRGINAKISTKKMKRFSNIIKIIVYKYAYTNKYYFIISK